MLLRLATPEDDPALRQLLRELPVDGPIRLSFQREPNYFLADPPGAQTLVGEENGRLAGLATRSLHRVWLHGRPIELPWLSNLRIHPDFQGRWLVQRGLRLLDQLHPDEGFLCTVTAGNPAEKVLRRTGRFHPLATVHTLAYRTQRPRPQQARPRPAYPEPGANLFPVDPDPSLPYYTVTQAGQVTAAAALWDQSHCKQTVIHGCSPWLRPFLPPPGTRLRMLYAAFVQCADPSVFPALLSQLLSARPADYLMLGLTGGHPCLRAARLQPHREYRSTLFWVSRRPLAIPNPHCEIALL